MNTDKAHDFEWRNNETTGHLYDSYLKTSQEGNRKQVTSPYCQVAPCHVALTVDISPHDLRSLPCIALRILTAHDLLRH